MSAWGRSSRLYRATDLDFEQLVLNSPRPAIVAFLAAWAGPATQLIPVLEQLADRWSLLLDVFVVDIDADPVLSRTYEIMSVPTISLFVRGAQPRGIVGIRSAEEIAAQFNLPYLDSVVPRTMPWPGLPRWTGFLPAPSSAPPPSASPGTSPSPAAVIVRTYSGRTQFDAARKFQRDATSLVGLGYFPVSQSWADGRSGCLRIITLGIIGALIWKPNGALTVTYQWQSPPVQP